MTLTAPPMIKGADVSFVSGLRGRGGLLIRLVRRAVTLASKVKQERPLPSPTSLIRSTLNLQTPLLPMPER